MIDRRAAIGVTTAALMAAALPCPALAASKHKPPRLRPGDTVGLVAPASAVTLPDELARAKHWIGGMGLVPKVGANVGARDGYLAGTDRQRAEDLNAMFANPEVRAIFAVRGGWGAARILPMLDWDVIRANPKLLIGYSDTTALHLAIAARAQFPTLHTPNATNNWAKQSWESLWRIAFAGATPTLGGIEAETESGRPGRTIRGGASRGRLLGGNLTVLSTLMGTPWLPEFDGAILFLEDVNEAEYRVDRMLQQLRLGGVLDRVAGVVFGQCPRCRSNETDYDGFTLDQVLDHHFANQGIPAFTDANIGHVSNQLSLPVGIEVELDADARTIRMLEPAVA